MKDMWKRFRDSACDVIICVCAVGILISGASIANEWISKAHDQKLVASVQLRKQEREEANSEKNNTISPSTIVANLKTEEDELEQHILEEYRTLYKENSDMYGWIQIEDTNINYPVMFTPEDPNFYEDKDWNKEVCTRSFGTSIWMDGRVTKETENILIYGHEMLDGTMFGSLKNYKNKEYYETHKYIQFDTIFEKQTYEIISVSRGVVYYELEPEEGEYLFYEHLELDSEEEFRAYIDNAKERSYYDIETTAEYGDRLITLCTCDNWAWNGRLLIVAKKVK